MLCAGAPHKGLIGIRSSQRGWFDRAKAWEQHLSSLFCQKSLHLTSSLQVGRREAEELTSIHRGPGKYDEVLGLLSIFLPKEF